MIVLAVRLQSRCLVFFRTPFCYCHGRRPKWTSVHMALHPLRQEKAGGRRRRLLHVLAKRFKLPLAGVANGKDARIGRHAARCVGVVY